MATGPVEPLESDQTHWEEDAPPREEFAPPLVPVVEIDADKELDAEMGLPRPGPQAWRLRHMMYLIAALAIVLWLGILVVDARAVGAFLVMGGIVFCFAGAMGGTVILARARSTRQDALLSVLAIAAERGMPLAPAILAFADQYRGLSYRRLMGLAAWVNWGTSLPESLERSGKLVSRDAILLAWIGHTAGTLPRALRMAANTRSNQLPIWTAISARLSYVLGLLLAMQTITGFIMYFIVPKFEAIFNDFNLSLPQITIAVINVSHFCIKFGYLAILVILGEVGLLVFLPLSFLSWSNYTIPLFDRLLGRRHAALVFRSLALTVEGGKPISQGLSTLTQHYPTWWIRRRLLSVEKEVAQGADWIDSLRYHRAIRSTDADVLRSAAEVGNLAWALMELAETAERRLATRFQMMVQTLFPIVVVALGVAVLIMAVAYFLPLVALITELTQR